MLKKIQRNSRKSLNPIKSEKIVNLMAVGKIPDELLKNVTNVMEEEKNHKFTDS